MYVVLVLHCFAGQTPLAEGGWHWLLWPSFYRCVICVLMFTLSSLGLNTLKLISPNRMFVPAAFWKARNLVVLEHTRAGFALPPRTLCPRNCGGSGCLAMQCRGPASKAQRDTPGGAHDGVVCGGDARGCPTPAPGGERRLPGRAWPWPRSRVSPSGGRGSGPGRAPPPSRKWERGGSRRGRERPGSGAARWAAPGLSRCAGRRAPSGRDAARVARPSRPGAGAGGAYGRAFTFLLVGQLF